MGRGEVLGKWHPAFTSPLLLAPPTPVAAGFVLLEARGKQDQRLQLGWRCTLLVRAGSSSCSAELTGDRITTIAAVSALHFPGEGTALPGTGREAADPQATPHTGTMEGRSVMGSQGGKHEGMSRQ